MKLRRLEKKPSLTCKSHVIWEQLYVRMLKNNKQGRCGAQHNLLDIVYILYLKFLSSFHRDHGGHIVEEYHVAYIVEFSM